MKNRWIGWFKPLDRGRRIGPLFFAPIFVEEGRKTLPLVITVPRACGNSVQRNRFRRMVRAFYQNELRDGTLSKQPLWIRLAQPYRLPKKIVLNQWSDILCRGFRLW